MSIVKEHIWISRQPFDDIDGRLLAHLMHLYFTCATSVMLIRMLVINVWKVDSFFFILIVKFQIKFYYIITHTDRKELFNGHHVRHSVYYVFYLHPHHNLLILTLMLAPLSLKYISLLSPVIHPFFTNSHLVSRTWKKANWPTYLWWYWHSVNYCSGKKRVKDGQSWRYETRASEEWREISASYSYKVIAASEELQWAGREWRLTRPLFLHDGASLSLHCFIF